MPLRFSRNYDLVEQITGQPAEAHVIVGTGSSAFVPLLHYVLSNEVQAIPPKAVINWWSTRFSIFLRLHLLCQFSLMMRMRGGQPEFIP